MNKGNLLIDLLNPKTQPAWEKVGKALEQSRKSILEGIQTSFGKILNSLFNTEEKILKQIQKVQSLDLDKNYNSIVDDVNKLSQLTKEFNEDIWVLKEYLEFIKKLKEQDGSEERVIKMLLPTARREWKAKL